jgi:hypothetical protein
MLGSTYFDSYANVMKARKVTVSEVVSVPSGPCEESETRRKKGTKLPHS